MLEIFRKFTAKFVVAHVVFLKSYGTCRTIGVGNIPTKIEVSPILPTHVGNVSTKIENSLIFPTHVGNFLHIIQSDPVFPNNSYSHSCVSITQCALARKLYLHNRVTYLLFQNVLDVVFRTLIYMYRTFINNIIIDMYRTIYL